MEIHQGLYILLGMIFFLGFLAIIGNIQLAHAFRQWLNEVERAERRNEAGTEGVQFGRADLIDQIVHEYTEHRSKGIEWVNTQVIVEKAVYERRLSLFGIFRLPLGVVERVVQQVPSWVIILGLLGTFTGLTLALFAMQSTLLQFGVDSGEEMMTVATIVAAIAEPFKGMSFAFITSIAGIGTAFLLYVLQSGFLSNFGIGPNYTQLKQRFLTKCEGFLDHHVQYLVQHQKPKDTLEKVLDRLVDKIRESFNQSVEAFGDQILLLTQKLNDNLTGIERVIKQSKSFTDEFHQGTSQLTSFGQVLQESMSQFHEHEQQVAARTDNLAQQVRTLHQELKQLSMKSSEGHQSLQKVVERSEYIIQNVMKKSDDMFQMFRQHAEQVQRSFKEQLDEQQRHLQQNQDEWYYRYQEKNDQFSRAAESFGQAVVHLEKQWEDGNERFKRDLSNQLGQMFEKYFGRQQHMHQEKDFRDVQRELQGIYHLLEREFENMYRFSQDVEQILHAIYEWGRTQMSQRRYVQEDSVRPVVRERRY